VNPFMGGTFRQAETLASDSFSSLSAPPELMPCGGTYQIRRSCSPGTFLVARQPCEWADEEGCAV
jgi:hypothetical protein